MTTIAVLLYDRFAILDFAGPVEVLRAWPDAKLELVAKDLSPVSSESGVRIVPTATLSDVSAPDVIVVPGTDRPTSLQHNDVLKDWLRRAAPEATLVSSVCTGSLLLSAAGLLAGRKATTHWAFADRLAEHEATYVPKRVVIDGNFVTSAGVSAGIDMALTLLGSAAGENLGKLVELALEYDPQPPFGTGSPEKAGVQFTHIARGALLGADVFQPAEF